MQTRQRGSVIYALPDWAVACEREFGKTAAFTVARGAQAGLADPAVNRFRDAVQVILKQGTPEECDWVETFKFNPEAEDGYQRFDARLTKREARAFDSFTDLLGLSRQTALVVACLLVLKDVAAIRADWRERMRLDYQRFVTKSQERAATAERMATQY